MSAETIDTEAFAAIQECETEILPVLSLASQAGGNTT